MATKPTTHATWATTGGTRLEPSAGQKAAGWTVNTRPPARWENWLRGNSADWHEWAFDFIGALALANWTERSNAKAQNLLGVAYSPSLDRFVAVGSNDGVDTYIIYSTNNGVIWTEAGNPKNLTCNAIAWSPTLSLFCAVGVNDGGLGYTYGITSPTGLGAAWTQRVFPRANPLNAIVWDSGNLVFVAVGDHNGVDAQIVTSPDGIVWTVRAPPAAKVVNANDVAYSPSLDRLCLVGANDGADAYILTSDDGGLNWVERANGATLLNCVAWSSKLNLFVASDGTNFWTSSDGITWASSAQPKVVNVTQIRWVDEVELFVAVGAYEAVSDDSLIWTSRDGSTWLERVNTKQNGLNAIASSPYATVLVGDNDGADADILTSLFY
jgi:hypothetical protein